tara:strand:+ start:648 stop:1205 length:558 start_codon:yes stop_codon:yes gene_type:complete
MVDKVCTRCSGTFPATLDYFYKNPRARDNLGTRCKTCCKLQVAEKWASNPEYFIEHSARRRALDREGENRRVNEIRKRSKAKGTACVYTITNKITGKIYVGETTWKHRRWTAHRSELKRGHHESSSLQKEHDTYGIDSFEFSIVKVIESKNKEELRTEEINTIKKLLSEGYELYNTANTKGGANV